jgi:hypothetical protein
MGTRVLLWKLIVSPVAAANMSINSLSHRAVRSADDQGVIGVLQHQTRRLSRIQAVNDDFE